MSRLIDADSLEREGWTLQRTYQKDENTMIYEVKKPSEMPIIEPKKGKWIWRTSDIYRCSECETDSHVAECMEEPIYNFCPYCGADMKGMEND